VLLSMDVVMQVVEVQRMRLAAASWSRRANVPFGAKVEWNRSFFFLLTPTS
jgi:hypothetical protein